MKTKTALMILIVAALAMVSSGQISQSSTGNGSHNVIVGGGSVTTVNRVYADYHNAPKHITFDLSKCASVYFKNPSFTASYAPGKSHVEIYSPTSMDCEVIK